MTETEEEGEDQEAVGEGEEVEAGLEEEEGAQEVEEKEREPDNPGCAPAYQPVLYCQYICIVFIKLLLCVEEEKYITQDTDLLSVSC